MCVRRLVQELAHFILLVEATKWNKIKLKIKKRLVQNNWRLFRCSHTSMVDWFHTSIGLPINLVMNYNNESVQNVWCPYSRKWANSRDGTLRESWVWWWSEAIYVVWTMKVCYSSRILKITFGCCQTWKSRQHELVIWFFVGLMTVKRSWQDKMDAKFKDLWFWLGPQLQKFRMEDALGIVVHILI